MTTIELNVTEKALDKILWLIQHLSSEDIQVSNIITSRKQAHREHRYQSANTSSQLEQESKQQRLNKLLEDIVLRNNYNGNVF